MDKRHTAPFADGIDKSEDDRFSVMSATECTGLIPAAPEDAAEAESYEDIYDVPVTKNRADHRSRRIKKTGSSRT